MERKDTLGKFLEHFNKSVQYVNEHGYLDKVLDYWSSAIKDHGSFQEVKCDVDDMINMYNTDNLKLKDPLVEVDLNQEIRSTLMKQLKIMSRGDSIIRRTYLCSLKHLSEKHHELNLQTFIEDIESLEDQSDRDNLVTLIKPFDKTVVQVTYDGATNQNIKKIDDSYSSSYSSRSHDKYGEDLHQLRNDKDGRYDKRHRDKHHNDHHNQQSYHRHRSLRSSRRQRSYSRSRSKSRSRSRSGTRSTSRRKSHEKKTGKSHDRSSGKERRRCTRSFSAESYNSSYDDLYKSYQKEFERSMSKDREEFLRSRGNMPLPFQKPVLDLNTSNLSEGTIKELHDNHKFLQDMYNKRFV